MRNLEVLCFLLIIFCLSCQTKKTSIKGIIDEESKKNGNCAISVLIYDSGRVNSYVTGYIDKSLKLKTDSNSIFELGSITKIFTSALLQKLIDEKKIDWNDPITNYLKPKYPANYKDVRLFHLASHTSGLPAMPNVPGIKVDPLNQYAHVNDAFYEAFFNDSSVVLNPNLSNFNYSNFGYGLLGLIIEHVSGKPYDKAMYDNIITKFGFSNLFFSNINVKTKYYLKSNSVVDRLDLAKMQASGALLGAAHSLLPLIKYSLKNDSSQPFSKILNKSTVFEKYKTGIAWIPQKIESNTVYFHLGGTNGCRSYIAINTKTKKATVVLVNQAISNIHELGDAIHAIIEKNL